MIKLACFDPLNGNFYGGGAGKLIHCFLLAGLSVSQSEITTYRQSYIVPLLIAAAALFLIDVAVRKIKRGKRIKETGKEKA